VTKEEQIRRALKEMASEVGPDSSLVAKVKSVDETNLTCDLIDDQSQLDFNDVLLRPVIDGSESLTIIPKVNSWVLAIRMEDSDDWVIIYCCDVAKFRLKCDDISFNGGTKGGLVNWPDAKVQLDKSNQIIAAMVSVFNSWTPVANDGGAALKTAMATALSGKSVGHFDNLEDTRVKH
jgi:hypothetical protein